MKKSLLDALAVGLSLLGAACASGSPRWFSFGPRPAEIAGVWIDVAHSSPTDTVMWILAPNGENRTRHISIARDLRGEPSIVVRERSNGFWYLSGRLDDTTRRAICYKRRSRDGGTCLHFTMDTVAAGFRRRLTVLGPAGQRLGVEKVFVERRP